MNKKIERINNKTNLILAIKEVKTDSKLKEIELNNKLELKKNESISIQYKTNILKHKNNEPKRIKNSGKILNLLSWLCFFSSVILSELSTNKAIHNLMNFIGIGLMLLIVQIIIFISAKYTNIIKTKFYDNYIGIKVLQITMLFVSISLNIYFIFECFQSIYLRSVLLPICFILDYGTIYFSKVSYDFVSFNYENKEDKKNITIFDKLIFNLVSPIKFKIEKKYNLNIELTQQGTNSKELITNSINPKELTQKSTNSKTNNKVLTHESNHELTNNIDVNLSTNSKVLTQELIKKSTNSKVLTQQGTNLWTNNEVLIKQIEKYINDNFEIGKKISTKDIQEKFSISKKTWDNKIKPNLKNIETNGTKTLRAC